MESTSNIRLMIATPDVFMHYLTQERFVPDILGIIVFQNFSTCLVQTLLPEQDSDNVPVLITSQVKPQSWQLISLINGKVDIHLNTN